MPVANKVGQSVRFGARMLVAAACITYPFAADGQTSCATTKQAATDSAALAFENTWATATAAHDTATLECILADSFVDTSWRGELRTRHDVLTTGPAAPSGLQQRFSDWRVTRFGAAAIVRGLNTITDASNRTVSALRFTDVLLYSKGRWHAVAAEETLVQSPPQRR